MTMIVTSLLSVALFAQTPQAIEGVVIAETKQNGEILMKKESIKIYPIDGNDLVDTNRFAREIVKRYPETETIYLLIDRKLISMWSLDKNGNKAQWKTRANPKSRWFPVNLKGSL